LCIKKYRPLLQWEHNRLKTALWMSPPFSVKTKTVSVSTNLSTGSASFNKTQMIQKRKFSDNYNWCYVVFSPLLLLYRLVNPVQINQNEKSDSGLKVYWGTERATKSSRIPWRRDTDIINCFHFLLDLCCPLRPSDCTEIPFTSTSETKRSFICNWWHFEYKKCTIHFRDKNKIPTNKRE
jgi:hypothetical protein